jgi:hypothetical protein
MNKTDGAQKYTPAFRGMLYVKHLFTGIMFKGFDPSFEARGVYVVDFYHSFI